MEWNPAATSARSASRIFFHVALSQVSTALGPPNPSRIALRRARPSLAFGVNLSALEMFVAARSSWKFVKWLTEKHSGSGLPFLSTSLPRLIASARGQMWSLWSSPFATSFLASAASPNHVATAHSMNRSAVVPMTASTWPRDAPNGWPKTRSTTARAIPAPQRRSSHGQDSLRTNFPERSHRLLPQRTRLKSPTSPQGHRPFWRAVPSNFLHRYEPWDLSLGNLSQGQVCFFRGRPSWPQQRVAPQLSPGQGQRVAGRQRPSSLLHTP
mmetsp:Transcript_19545/g.59164  ORF Transcript_19545/g.59164 Transcript_19545/m.59164 type:complete len:269 (-) Transcript_19545:781-1587(-)